MILIPTSLHKLPSSPLRQVARLLTSISAILLFVPGLLEAAGISQRPDKKSTTGTSGQFWKNVEKASPLIQQRANAVLQQLGYDPHTYASHVFFAGQGEEIWTVAYWHQLPELLITKGDIEAYFNIRGEAIRVMKFEQGREQLLYGKDERILNGFTPNQVQERLGSPDSKGPPPINIKRSIADELWNYKRNATRTMTIHVYFKDGRVSSVSYLGE